MARYSLASEFSVAAPNEEPIAQTSARRTGTQRSPSFHEATPLRRLVANALEPRSARHTSATSPVPGAAGVNLSPGSKTLSPEDRWQLRSQSGPAGRAELSNNQLLRPWQRGGDANRLPENAPKLIRCSSLERTALSFDMSFAASLRALLRSDRARFPQRREAFAQKYEWKGIPGESGGAGGIRTHEWRFCSSAVKS